MITKIYLVFVVIPLFVFDNVNTFLEDSPRLCICFSHDAKYIDMSFSEDSTLVTFNIVNKGFETEEQREKAKEKAMEEWSKNKLIPYSPPPLYITFTSIWEPEKLTSIENIKDCAIKITLNEYRQNSFKYPEGIGGNKVYFIQKIKNDKFLKWSAFLMAIE